MKHGYVRVLAIFCLTVIVCPAFVQAGIENDQSVIVATGKDVPTDEHLPESYRFPEKYQDDAVQFRTEDGVLLCGYVIGEGDQGITLGHANGWMLNSWLPFGERLVEAGYRIIIWEFRNIPPSGSAPESESLRWDLDVLAAARVLKERGAAKILSIGASDGGNATAVAAPAIPDLVGLALLSAPANSKGNGLEGVGKIDVPAFFAVSEHDPGGNFYDEVKALYDACASPQKEFHVLTSYEHGTDLLSDVDVYSAKVGSSQEQKQERRQLADDLLQFVNKAFGNDRDEIDHSRAEAELPVAPNLDADDAKEAQTDARASDSGRNEKSDIKVEGSMLKILGIGIVSVAASLAAAAVVFWLCRHSKKK